MTQTEEAQLITKDTNLSLLQVRCDQYQLWRLLIHEKSAYLYLQYSVSEGA